MVAVAGGVGGLHGSDALAEGVQGAPCPVAARLPAQPPRPRSLMSRRQLTVTICQTVLPLLVPTSAAAPPTAAPQPTAPSSMGDAPGQVARLTACNLYQPLARCVKVGVAAAPALQSRQAWWSRGGADIRVQGAGGRWRRGRRPVQMRCTPALPRGIWGSCVLQERMARQAAARTSLRGRKPSGLARAGAPDVACVQIDVSGALCNATERCQGEEPQEAAAPRPHPHLGCLPGTLWSTLPRCGE